jgi:leader peptidase (prepilin peptidase)/N-methyltransferase
MVFESGFFLAWIALIGLVVGSYLNVLIHRIPRGKSTVLPRSSCPWCQGPIRARDNLPVVSFLLLRGRCRNCGAPIAWRYPIIEALTALLFVASFLEFGIGPRFVQAVLFSCLMVLLAAIDIEHFLLPDRLTLPGIAVGLGLQLWSPMPGLFEAVVGTLIGAGILILVINYWYWWRGEEGMGIGDVNMLAMIGAFLGWQGVLATLVLATVSGALVGSTMLVAGRLGLRSRLPFGFFLALGGLLTLFFGDSLIAYYSGLL